jgi:transcriptional regulator with XRE-family HTH domain
VTGAQLRAARGILNWSVRQLADAAGVAVSVVRRLEEVDGPPTTFESIFPLIKQAIEDAGVEFLFPPLGKPGVRPR